MIFYSTGLAGLVWANSSGSQIGDGTPGAQGLPHGSPSLSDCLGAPVGASFAVHTPPGFIPSVAHRAQVKNWPLKTTKGLQKTSKKQAKNMMI